MPYWDIIDKIWNNYLHTHLHSAAYYLNPFLFYSNGFFMDSEVTNGAIGSIVRMSENQRQEELISVQLESYRAALGRFSEKMALDHISQVPPGYSNGNMASPSNSLLHWTQGLVFALCALSKTGIFSIK